MDGKIQFYPSSSYWLPKALVRMWVKPVSCNSHYGLQIKGGLRYEHTLTDIRSAEGVRYVSRNYGNFFLICCSKVN